MTDALNAALCPAPRSTGKFCMPINPPVEEYTETSADSARFAPSP